VAVSWNGPNSTFHDLNCNFKCDAPASSIVHDQGELAAVLHHVGSKCPAPPPPPPPPAPAGWQPPDWAAKYATGALLNSSAADKSAQVGNGYIGFFVGGGTEYIAGFYTGELTATGKHCTKICGKCTSHRAPVPSVLTTAQVGTIDGTVAVASAAAIDLDVHAYLTAIPSATTKFWCQQRLYAHRARAHLLVLEVTCTNPTSKPVAISISGGTGTSLCFCFCFCSCPLP
jgi:hypothetical protein